MIWSLTQANAIESVDAAKYLGVTISKDLSWNTYINNITCTANKTLGFVKRNVVTKNKDIKTMAYNSLVRPQVEYACRLEPLHQQCCA